MNNKEFERGYNDGYNVGYQDGHKAATADIEADLNSYYNIGYSSGKADAREQFLIVLDAIGNTTDKLNNACAELINISESAIKYIEGDLNE